jgi:hypothetical protein
MEIKDGLDKCVHYNYIHEQRRCEEEEKDRKLIVQHIENEPKNYKQNLLDMFA